MFGEILQILGLVLATTLLTSSNDRDEPALYGLQVCIGFGMGFVMGTATLLTPAIAERRDLGESSGFGMALLIGLMLTITTPGNGIDYCWRNTLRLNEVPWVADHKVEDQIVFPAAGYLAIAIEALSQILGDSLPLTPPIEFQNVSFNAALIVKDEGSGADSEIHTVMAPRRLSTKQLSSVYYDFSVSSWKSNHVLTHCSGGIRLSSATSSEGSVNIQDSVGYRMWPMKRWYEKASEEGLVFGPHMRSIIGLQADRSRLSSDSICTTHTKPLALAASSISYQVHPITIDACLQAAILSAAAGTPNSLRPYLPVFLPKCVMRPSTFAGPSSEAYIHVRSHKTGISNLKADCTLRDAQGNPMADFDGIKLSLYDGKLVKTSSNDLHLQRHPVMRVFWKPDAAHLHAGTRAQLDDYIAKFSDSHDQEFQSRELASVAALLDLLSHKNPRIRVVEIQDEATSEPQNRYLQLLDDGTAYPRYISWSKSVVGESNRLPILGNGVFDVLIDTRFNPQIPWDQLEANLSLNGSIMARNSEEASAILQAKGFTTIPVRGDIILATRALPQSSLEKTEAIILTRKPSLTVQKLADSLETHLRNNDVQAVSVVEFESLSNSSTITRETLVISLLELENELLGSLSEEHMNLLRTATDTVKNLLWVTGANMLAEPNPDLAMAPGLSRSIIMEQPSLNFNILDVGPVVGMGQASIATTCDNVVRIMFAPRAINDKEFIQHNRLLYISRLGSDFSTNALFRRRLGMEQGFQQTTLGSAGNARLEVGQPGITDSLYFQQHPAELSESLPKGYIDVKTQAVSLNAKDIYAISGRVETRNATKSLEYVGIVTAIGPKLRRT
ncbi:unnamed protein product [Clonostachys rosea f. rosea IK726]|uniref:Uncharacterized protein n=1 Tax=Clonostachys rosea f. rosea IK726 TaxID=1349383 RepID=A0ACA9TP87_BIOOC|nr:unnamed protein product [Clonostachys rosea f. rosea IK726]